MRSTFQRDATAPPLVVEKSLKATAGVQALAILALRTAAGRWKSQGPSPEALVGKRPSLAASLCDAVKNCPQWLREMFGEALGVPYVSHVLLRTNHEATQASEPMSVRLNEEILASDAISVYSSGREVRSPYELQRTALEIESEWLNARDPNLRKETRAAVDALVEELRRAADKSRFDVFMNLAAQLLDERAVLLIENGDLPFTGQTRGREAILAATAKNFGGIAEHEINIFDVVTLKDSFVILGRDVYRMHGETTFRSVNYAQRYVLQNGKIVLVHHVTQVAGDVGADGADRSSD